MNLGTPDNPSPSAVGRYLREFLGDARVIDIPYIARKILVNGIIAPTRKYKSSAEYKKVWTEKGSPLLLYTEELLEKLKVRFEGEEVSVEMAMRYQSPSMDGVLAKMEKANYDKLVILPLYPQYASATTGSTIEKAMEIISKWYVIPEVSMVSQFYDDEKYINTLAEIAKPFDFDSYDHILFSYHGLPERQVDKVYEDRKCSNHSCETEINEENKFCYKATCYATTRLLAGKLGIPEERYTVCFQSRLDKKWLKPFSDVVIEEMRSVVSQVARALELVLGVILLAGALVLVAGVQSSLDGRLKESALLRALGARRQVVLGTLWIEFLVLGALAGALGTAGAEAAAWGLQTAVFDMTWTPTLLMWWLGPLLGALTVGSLGVWSCRRVVNTPPVTLLREV